MDAMAQIIGTFTAIREDGRQIVLQYWRTAPEGKWRKPREGIDPYVSITTTAGEKVYYIAQGEYKTLSGWRLKSTDENAP
jgi:hypothetical protein